jgi:hypothetical protein
MCNPKDLTKSTLFILLSFILIFISPSITLIFWREPIIINSIFTIFKLKDAVQSVCKQRLCLHFGIQNIEFYSTTIYIFMILEYNKLRRDNNQALQEHKMK